MAGTVTTTKPLGAGSTTGKVTADELPQQLGALIFGAGNVNSKMYGFTPNITQSLTLSTDNSYHPAFGKQRVFQAVSPNDSGNVGTYKPFAAGNWDSMQKGYYITMGYMLRFAGISSSLLNNPAHLAPYSKGNYSRGDTYVGINDWSYISGVPTYNANRGVQFNYYDGFGNAITQQAYPTDSVPGVLIYLVTGKIPTKSQYGPRHNS